MPLFPLLNSSRRAVAARDMATQREQLRQKRAEIKSALLMAHRDPRQIRRNMSPLSKETDPGYLTETFITQKAPPSVVMALWQANIADINRQLNRLPRPGLLSWLDQWLKRPPGRHLDSL